MGTKAYVQYWIIHSKQPTFCANKNLTVIDNRYFGEMCTSCQSLYTQLGTFMWSPAFPSCKMQRQSKDCKRSTTFQKKKIWQRAAADEEEVEGMHSVCVGETQAHMANETSNKCRQQTVGYYLLMSNFTGQQNIYNGNSEGFHSWLLIHAHS